MKKNTAVYLRVSLLIMILTVALSSPAGGGHVPGNCCEGQYSNNAVYLTHNYVKWPTGVGGVDDVPDLAQKMDAFYEVGLRGIVWVKSAI